MSKPVAWGASPGTGKIWLSVLTAVAIAPAVDAAAAEQRRPNVVVILIDDMGYGDLGCYGSKEIRTPNIDRLAREGVRLTDGYANGPVCTPTRCGFITGRYQQRVGLEWAIGPGMKKPGLAASETSIARMLNDHGYATALYGKWHLGYRPEFNPVSHGFDKFFGILSGNVDHYAHREINGEADLYEGTHPVEKTGYLTDLITARAVQEIQERSKQPFFLYVAYNAVHWPFQPPGHPDERIRATWFNGSRRDYAAMLERVDAGVGQILEVLDREKLTDSTLVVFTDDNGGERLSDCGPFSQGKGTLWEGGIRVPYLLRWPGHLPAGLVSHQPVITMDITASIIAATGATVPSGRKLDGMDVLPVLAGKQPAVERTFYWRIDRQNSHQHAVRQGKWKYLRIEKVELLFDLDADLAETRDLSSQQPALVAKLRELYEKWQADVDRHRPEIVVR